MTGSPGCQCIARFAAGGVKTQCELNVSVKKISLKVAIGMYYNLNVRMYMLCCATPKAMAPGMYTAWQINQCTILPLCESVMFSSNLATATL